MRSGLSGRLASSIFSSRRASIAMPAAWRYLPENKNCRRSGRTLSGGGLSGTGSSLAGLSIGQPRDTWHATDRGAAGSATRQRRSYAAAAHFRQSAQARALACCAAARTLRVLNVRRCW